MDGGQTPIPCTIRIAPRKSACARFSFPTFTWVRAIAARTELLKFLESIEVDYLFLVGDIVDFWSLRRTFYWPRRAQRGVARDSRQGQGRHARSSTSRKPRRKHPRVLRLVVRQCEHPPPNTCMPPPTGGELLVMHGDEFDAAVKCSRWLARFGATRVRIHDAHQSRRATPCRRALRTAVLVARQLPQTASAERRALRRSIRTCRRASRAQPRTWTGIVCGHIHRAGDARDRRRALLQRRRLGRKLHGARRGHERRAVAVVMAEKMYRRSGSRNWSRSPPETCQYSCTAVTRVSLTLTGRRVVK